MPTRLGICLRPRYERFRATRQRVVPACVRSGNNKDKQPYEPAELDIYAGEQPGVQGFGIPIERLSARVLLLMSLHQPNHQERICEFPCLGDTDGVVSWNRPFPDIHSTLQSFMISFDSSEIVNWADQPDADHVLPELVRRLILATAPLPEFLDMPSGSSVRMPGWDGLLSVSEGNPWLPADASAWEFSCEKGPKGKADRDYEKRKENPQGEIPSQTAFVFATARRFRGKKSWLNKRRQEGHWANVRALDADDIVAWLEQAPAVAGWFARLIGKLPETGVVPLDEWWENWSSATQPKIIPELVAAGRGREADALGEWVKRDPGHWYVQGDTRDESIAFLAGVAHSAADQWGAALLARALVVKTEDAWRSLERHAFPLALVRDFIGGVSPQTAVSRGHHVLTPLDASQDPRGDGQTLARLGREDTSTALAKMGIPKSKVDDLTSKTARRLPVLRRFLIEEAGFPEPDWVALAPSSLTALVLIGQWEEDNEGDREIIENLIRKSFEEIEEDLAAVSGIPDPPVVKVERRWRFTSHEEAWNILAPRLTQTQAARFKELAATVLGQVSPAFELHPGERYMASVLGKSLPHSSTLREGMARTLALMGVYPERARNAESVQHLPLQVIREVLSEGKGWQIWATLDSDLATLAEAAPDAVLDAVERDLSANPSPFRELFGQGGAPLFAGIPYVGLLGALERIAWSADHFARVAMILARLAEYEPDNNVRNRPTESLRSLFLPGIRFSETTDSHRLETLKALADRYPQAGWSLLIRIHPSNNAMFINHRLPRWRSWGQDVSSNPTHQEFWGYVGTIGECLLSGINGDAQRWAIMMNIVSSLAPENRTQALSALSEQVEGLRQQPEALALWHRIRSELNRHRSYPDEKWAMATEEVSVLADAYSRLTPLDPVSAHAWLFDGRPKLPNPLPALSTPLEDRDNQLYEAQWDAVHAIHAQGGEVSIVRLAEEAALPLTVGHAVSRVFELDVAISLALPHIGAENSKLRDFAHGVMAALSFRSGWEPLEPVLDQLKEEAVVPSRVAALYLAGQANMETWQRLAAECEAVQEIYWNAVPAFQIPRENPDDLAFAVIRLIQAQRSLDLVDFLSVVDVSNKMVEQVLEQAPVDYANEIAAGRQRRIDAYDIGSLFESLDQSNDISNERIAQLEIPYIYMMHEWQRQPALHREILRQPFVFADFISWVFKRSDGSMDGDVDEETRSNRAEAAFTVLWRLRRIPGQDDNGAIDADAMDAWVSEARRLCHERDRGDTGEEQIGQILANAPIGADGAWPCEPVRDLLDRLGSPHIGQGFTTGKFNLRGVTSRGMFDGGEQERSLADGYRADAARIASSWPFTAQLLRRMADSYESSGRQFDRESDWRDQFES